MVETLIWLIPLPPLLAFFLIALFTHRRRALSHWLALAGVGLSWLGSMIVFIQAVARPDLSERPFHSMIAWMPVAEGFFPIGVLVDPLAAVVLFFVAWTILMIFIYSVGYHHYGRPEGERDRPGLPPQGTTITDTGGNSQQVSSVEPLYTRYFAFIALFAFAMYALVVSDNLLTLYIAWEIMGLCSYLLIGFWFGRETANRAAVKAFLTTRVGDLFMLLGIAALYALTGTLNFRAVLNSPELLQQLAEAVSPVAGLSWAGLIGLLIFMGTVGKSAQFPLHVWLPDAMEGPTTVSAMIHAATMVSAGVYLSARFFPLLTVGWQPGEPQTTAMLVMAAVGAFTALFAASIAVAQNDIKRVLAYSTISQLGYMVAALGVGAYTAAVFHLMTHAFFKALLFLGSGSVIHGMEHGRLHSGEQLDQQDMMNMGGLRRRMPRTFWTFVAGGLALAGFPLVTAGFWSKDEILAGAYNGGHLLVFVTLALAALLTAFYVMRQITLIFLGQPRTEAARHAGEAPAVMTIPLAFLALFAVAAGWVGIPEGFPALGGLLPNWFETFVGSSLHDLHLPAGHSQVPLLTSLAVALGGLVLGWRVYRRLRAGAPDPLRLALGKVFVLLQNKYYVDELYDLALIRPARWLAETFTDRWIDRGLLDGILQGLAAAGIWFGNSLRNIIDLPVVNGAGDALSQGARRLGFGLRILQSGRVQQYMVLTLLALLAVGFGLYYFLILA